MTPEQAIARAIPNGPETSQLRIALFGLVHAAAMSELDLSRVGQWLADFLDDPVPLTRDFTADYTASLARNLRRLAGNLEHAGAAIADLKLSWPAEGASRDGVSRRMDPGQGDGGPF